jgi:hypothetical protein
VSEELVGALVLGICGAGSGALVHAVTRAAARGSLARNGLAGIRTRRTTSSDAAWLAGHAAALPWTRRTAWATAALGLVTVLTAVLSPAAGVAVGLGATGVLLAGCLLATRAAHRAIADGATRRG